MKVKLDDIYSLLHSTEETVVEFKTAWGRGSAVVLDYIFGICEYCGV